MKRKANLVRMFNTQSGFCAYCTTEMTLALNKPNTATRDHVVPKCEGGKSSKFNLVAACSECNRRKGSMSLCEFLGTFEELKCK